MGIWEEGDIWVKFAATENSFDAGHFCVQLSHCGHMISAKRLVAEKYLASKPVSLNAANYNGDQWGLFDIYERLVTI